jgi:hypothetical protein
MIGRRLATSAMAVVAVAGGILLLGPGGPSPAVEVAARRAILRTADEADVALSGLAAALVPAVDAGRAGSARAVAGDEAPGPMFADAAELTRAAEAKAAAAREALVALNRARNARDPGASELEPVAEPGELDSIAEQLSAAAEAGDEFAAMRDRALSVIGELDDAIAALDAGDLAGARDHVGRARDAHTAVAAWDVGLVTLPVWVETTDAMIAAVERIITATERGDSAAAQRAAEDFVARADDAAPADRALRIAIGEGGSAVAAVPLERLATILTSIDDARAAVASVREAAQR